jgi:phosphoglycolate phosphatase
MDLKKLVFFDIDGTLVDLDDVHLESYQGAYKSVTGRDVPRTQIRATFGMTEVAQHQRIFRELGLPVDSDRINKLIGIYDRNFIDVVQSRDVLPLDGVIDFLRYLSEAKIGMGIITGNWEKKSRVILQRIGLEKYFAIFGFDDESNSQGRRGIAKKAFGEATKIGYQRENIIIVGDTESDVDAAKHLGVQCVGVATGRCSVSDLEKAGADMVVPNLTKYLDIVERFRLKR